MFWAVFQKLQFILLLAVAGVSIFTTAGK